MAVKKVSFGDDDDAKVSEVTINETDAKVDTGRVWVNTLKNPLNLPITCRVPQKVLIMMRSVEQLMMKTTGLGTQEFGVFLSGQMNDNGHFVLTEDFYIPSQKVTTASIDFTEEPPDKKYNGVVHRHPTGCKNFSGTDAHNINKNFDFSLLYEGNDIILGVWNLDYGGHRIQVPLKIEVMYPVYDLTAENIISKIQREEMPSSTMFHRNDNTDSRFSFGGPTPINRKLLVESRQQEDFFEQFNQEQQNEKDNEPLGLLHICKSCGEVIRIEAFPQVCESCDAILTDEDDAVLVSNVDQYDEETKQRIKEKLDDEHDEREAGIPGYGPGPFFRV